MVHNLTSAQITDFLTSNFHSNSIVPGNFDVVVYMTVKLSLNIYKEKIKKLYCQREEKEI